MDATAITEARTGRSAAASITLENVGKVYPDGTVAVGDFSLEVRAGELVVFIPGHCGQAGRLEFLLMAAAEISKRIQAELSEAAQAGSL